MQKINKFALIIIYLCIFIFIQNIASADESANKTAASKTISLNFHEIDVRELLRILAEFSDKNVIISDKINDHISINLHNVSWNQALNTILNMRGLSKHEDNLSYILAPAMK